MASVLIRAHVPTESKLVSLFDWAEVIGRIGLALLFLWSGYEKLAHPASTVAYMQAHGLPAAGLLIWPAALFELAGGAMLALGWKLRWMALALAGYTFAATFVFHAYWSWRSHFFPARWIAATVLRLRPELPAPGSRL